MTRFGKNILACSLVLAMSGCYKLNFQNGAPHAPGMSQAKQWRHNGIIGLVEFSPPLDLSRSCGGNWREVKTKQTFAQGVVSVVLGQWYTPWTAGYSCR